ncbi:MAG TPA: DNA polymerase Y family protein [Rhizobiaceae bacterium]|nr:DNA polymerase Y family protein [Rhizobiaceae bacterium]
MVISHHENNTQRISALDEQAEVLHLKRGMGLADARAMHPSVDVVESDPEAERKLLESIADWCDRYTPLVAIEGSDGLFLDITGCAHLFGGEEMMLYDLVSRLSGQGFDTRTGLAGTPGAAWAAARYRLPPIELNGEKEVLAPLPLAALRLDEDVRIKLESVGLRTVGAIIQTPRAPLARRFGARLLIRLDQALGTIDEAISPRLPVAALSVERHFAEPISLIEDVERILWSLAGNLKRDLERRGEGARRLQLSLFRVDGAVSRIAVGTSRPMREPAFIARLFHERLATLAGDIDAGYGFDLVRLSVLATAIFDETQSDLAGVELDAEENIALFADRVRARLGDHVILRPFMVESHIPERAVRLDPFTDVSVRKTVRAIKSDEPSVTYYPPERPLRLFREPEPVEVTAEIPEGPPASFRWRRSAYRVVGAEGPERIAPEWWRKTETSATRDYYRVEDEEGRRYWLFREGFYGDPKNMPKWFVQGLFP